MATNEEVQAEVERRAELLADILIADPVKQEIASVGLVMEACFAEAKRLEEALQFPPQVVGFGAAAARGRDQKEIALAIFDAVIKRSLMAQQQAMMNTVPLNIRDLKMH